MLQYWKQYPTDINDSSVGDGVNVVGHRFAAPIDNLFNTYISKLNFNAGSNHAAVRAWHAAGRHGRPGTGVSRRRSDTDDEDGQPRNGGRPHLGGELAPCQQPSLWLHAASSWTTSASETRSTPMSASLMSSMGSTRRPRVCSGTRQPTTSGTTSAGRSARTRSRMGGEARFIRNDRSSDALSFHGFTVNPSWLPDGGRSIEPGQVNCDRPGCFAVPASAGVNFRDRLTSMLGPISQVDAAYNFNAQGETLDDGAIVPRRFAANEYEVYFQDQWRLHPSLTLKLGLRYMNATPPWETNGNQVIPVPVNPSLNGSFGAWFKCRDDMRLAGRRDGRLRFDRNPTRWSGQRRPAVLRPRQQQPLAAHRCGLVAGRRQVVDSRRLLAGLRPDGHGAGEYASTRSEHSACPRASPTSWADATSAQPTASIPAFGGAARPTRLERQTTS